MDECSFNISLVPSKGWCKKEKKNYCDKPPKSINYSLIACISLDGILGYIVFEKSINTENFISFLLAFLQKSFSNMEEKKKIILVLDNAAIHNSSEIKEKVTPFVFLQYLPPYTPQLNPIELAFNKIKHYVKQRMPHNEQELLGYINNSMKTITSNDCFDYYCKIFQNLKKAYELNDLV